MARPKEFNPEAVLDDAMRLFWARGFDGTSTADVVAGTGIARASLYATFGNKRELYLACLDHYLAGAGLPTPEEAAAGADTGLGAVRALLESAAVCGSDEVPGGCFAVNATVEHGSSDPELARRLEANRVRMESTVHTALLRAQREGDVRVDADPAALASMLLALMTGMRSLGRAGAGQQARLAAAVDAALQMITS